MIKSILSVYGLRYPATIVYMLQSVEYQVEPYLKWYWRTADFGKVAKRRKLESTRAAKMLLLAVTAGMLIEVMLGTLLSNHSSVYISSALNLHLLSTKG